MQNVRVRYAPSPTGSPHIGNIRTAMFNWLLARHHGGKFIVRIEDTDQTRLVPGALDAILGSLRWLGLSWDEGPEVGGSFGPYFQSERLPIYKQHAEQLVAGGHAYHCYCTSERLEQVREEQMARKETIRYDRACRELSADDRRAREEAGTPYVVRFKAPLAGQTIVRDLFRGDIAFDNATLDDHVLLKSDGWPTYQLANVVDDHLMAITHVLRGDEWISSAPKHVLEYEAFGWRPPVFGHLSLILGKDRTKLSKRHGATDVLSYREAGYLPDALVNFLALLGWSPPEEVRAEGDILSRAELVRLFDLDRVGVTPSVFDNDKLDW
ncbi:MAG: glutamate--tRNA ligase, partial [Chloroflexota bacterium]